MKSTSQGTVRWRIRSAMKTHRALEDADEDQVAALVVAADLLAELGDPPLEVLGGDEDLADRLRRPRPLAQARSDARV